MKIWNISGIRKTMIRTIGWLMVLCLFGSFAAAEGLSREDYFNEGLRWLEEMTVESVRDAAENFSAAGSYELAPEYRQYALSLIDILSMGEEEVNIRSTVNRLQLAGENEGFRKSLTDKGLPSCESLVQYIQARQYEEAGDYIAARNIYKTVRHVLDSMDRQTSLSETAYQQAEELYRNGDYQAAAEIFRNLDYADSAEKYQQVLVNHEHQWKEATCTEPRTCQVLGETEGKPLGHDWQAATCTEPKTCRRCGITQGKALGHDWQAATYTDPKKCARCGATVGYPLIIPAGTVIAFGRYEQDNDRDNGPEAIEWIVLSYNEKEHKALLLSRYGLDTKPYNTDYTAVTWDSCSLRTWLNSDFLNAAFSKDEQSAILPTIVDNSVSQRYIVWDANGGKNTHDQIFLLSYLEAKNYLGVTKKDFKNTRSRVAPTAYAIAQGAWTSQGFQTEDGSAAGRWWLRSPGTSQFSAAFVDRDGSLNSYPVDEYDYVVCPALWIDIVTLESISQPAAQMNVQYPVKGHTNVNVNFRAEPSIASARHGVLKEGTQLTVNALITAEDGTEWYLVDVNGRIGYIKTDFVSILSDAD